ncbi:MAG: hypothetical protein AAGH76_01495 [Pseudomonadota bacterium]
MNDDAVTQPDKAEAIWQAALARATLWPTLKEMLLLVFGVTPFLLRRVRLETVRKTALARWLHTELARASHADAMKIATLARVHREMVDSSFRQIVVANVTVPVALLAVLNEVLDEGLVHFAFEVFETKASVIAVGVTVFATILATVLYSYAVTINARDLHTCVQLARPDVGGSAESGSDSLEDAV